MREKPHGRRQIVIAEMEVLLDDESTRGILARGRRSYRAVYSPLGLKEKARFASFVGPHRIDGAESFPFLDAWLKEGKAGR